MSEKSKKGTAKSLPQSLEVVYGDGKTVVVYKLPLGKYTEVLNAIQSAPEMVRGFLDENQGAEDIIASLPTLITNFLDDFIRILSAATGLDEKILSEEVALTEAVEMAEAVIEVNRFFELTNKLWKPEGQVLQTLMNIGEQSLKEKSVKQMTETEKTINGSKN